MGASVKPLQYVARELQRRSVFHVLAVYGAVSFVVLQASDLVLPALSLPDWIYRALVLVVLAGFPLAALLAWFFDLTPDGIRRAPLTAQPDETGPVRRVHRRFQILSLVLITVLVTAAGGLGAVRARLGEPRADDGRIAVAIFPFRAAGLEGGEWTEGIADLLATALDGTPGLRVVDPWSLWQELRDQPNAVAASPSPTTAAALGREAGARRIVLGSIVGTGADVQLSVRVYDPRFARPLETFALRGTRADLTGLVQRLAAQVIARAWDEEALPGVPRLEPNATQSPEALKAYLTAKMAMRRGLVDSATAAIDRATTLDSTFALALLDAVHIRSWYLSMTGRPYQGFFEALGRAQRHDDSLSERNQLRLQALIASVETRGQAAASALERIIAIDSTDLSAWATLAYVRNVYGWQFGVDHASAAQAADRVVRLDPYYIPGLVQQTWLRLAEIDSTGANAYIGRLRAAGEDVTLVRNTVRGLQALTAEQPAFASLAREMSRAPLTDWITAYRYLRAYHPARAEALLANVRADVSAPAYNNAVMEDVRLRVAEGRPASADTVFQTVTSVDAALLGNVQRILAAASLADLGPVSASRRAVDALARYVPADSVRAYDNTRPTWWIAWLVGAHHAQLGDTVIARRYQAAIGTLQPGGSPATYREALHADIESRLAQRHGNAARALEEARRAYDQWSIHTENQLESMPEPAIRFHLGMLLNATGDTRSAEALFRSMVPPTSWFGFYTARAALELGDLEAKRGESQAAARHYSMALRLWERGGREAEAWRAQAETRLASLLKRTRG